MTSVTNECQFCAPAISTTAWSNKSSVTACGATVGECDNQDTCDGNGQCVDNGFEDDGTDCGSGLTCTTGACN